MKEPVDDTLEIDPQAGGETAQTAGDSDKPEPKEKSPADDALKETRRALKEVRETLKQTNETARFWMEQARGGGKKDEPAEEIEPTTSVDLVEAITAGDTKAIAKAMREMGFVSAKDVAATIGATRKEVSAEAKLIGKYPDLEDDQSEMFRRTADIYNDLSRDPDMKRSPRLAEIAARMADNELNSGNSRDTGDVRKPRRAADVPDDDIDEDEERERVERVARQSGDRGRRPPQGTREGDELDPMQKSIVAKLRAAGADISEEGYRKRAKSGVRMAGLPTRRPRY